MALTEVIALERGHDGRTIREAGEKFHVDLEDARFKGATWFSKPEDAPPPKPKPKNERPPGAGPKPGSAVHEQPPAGAAQPPVAGSGEF